MEFLVWARSCSGFRNSNCYACCNVRICRFSKLDADVKSRFMQAFLSILFATMGGLSFPAISSIKANNVAAHEQACLLNPDSVVSMLRAELGPHNEQLLRCGTS